MIPHSEEIRCLTLIRFMLCMSSFMRLIILSIIYISLHAYVLISSCMSSIIRLIIPSVMYTPLHVYVLALSCGISLIFYDSLYGCFACLFSLCIYLTMCLYYCVLRDVYALCIHMTCLGTLTMLNKIYHTCRNTDVFLGHFLCFMTLHIMRYASVKNTVCWMSKSHMNKSHYCIYTHDCKHPIGCLSGSTTDQAPDLLGQFIDKKFQGHLLVTPRIPVILTLGVIEAFNVSQTTLSFHLLLKIRIKIHTLPLKQYKPHSDGVPIKTKPPKNPLLNLNRLLSSDNQIEPNPLNIQLIQMLKSSLIIYSQQYKIHFIILTPFCHLNRFQIMSEKGPRGAHCLTPLHPTISSHLTLVPSLLSIY